MKPLFSVVGLTLLSNLAMPVSIVRAADITCAVCGMNIPEHARHHIILKRDGSGKPSLHVCSPSCARKAKKHDHYSAGEIIDFNHPDKFLSVSQAYFLTKSENIKKGMGDSAMPPYLAAFATKEEAEVAQKRFGDGIVVQGFDNALK